MEKKKKKGGGGGGGGGGKGEKAEGGDDEACESKGHPKIPVVALAGQQGDGGDDEADFEQSLAEIEAIGAVFGFADFGFILECGGLGFGEILVLFLDVGSCNRR